MLILGSMHLQNIWNYLYSIMDCVFTLDLYGRGLVQKGGHLALASATNVVRILNFFHL